jgi:hypothetical protein
MQKKEPKFMTAREFAAAISRPYPTVALWLRQGLIPQATSIQLGAMRVWQIPLTVIETFEPPKIGRPKKKTSGGKGGKATKKGSAAK